MGRDVESASDMWYMYDTLLGDERNFLYGRGFTLYGLINSNLQNVPPYKQIEANIRAHYYDLVIYGSIIKSKMLLTLVEQYYSAAEIIFIDGEDIDFYEQELVSRGIYFKRELKEKVPGLHPISFAIPEEKIVQQIPAKTRDWAINYPGRLNTYIHHTEESYYNDYQTSKFAVTFKKEGWDCMRHYEIIANGCLPYFTDILNCPAETMLNFPKQIVTEIYTKIKAGQPISDQEYEDYATQLLKYTRLNLTTVALAMQVLNTAAEIKKGSSAKPRSSNNNTHVSWGDIADKFISYKPNGSENTLIYAGVATVQNARFLADKFSNTIICDTYKSASVSFAQINTAINVADDLDQIAKTAGTIVLDHTLTYREDVTDYLIKARSLMNSGATLIVIVPNLRSISSIIGFVKHNLKFGKLKLAKRSPANFYSVVSITRVLKAFGFNVKSVSYYGFNNTHFIKRFFNRFKSLSSWTCETLFIEADLSNE